jgi:hypothetical protein
MPWRLSKRRVVLIFFMLVIGFHCLADNFWILYSVWLCFWFSFLYTLVRAMRRCLLYGPTAFSTTFESCISYDLCFWFYFPCIRVRTMPWCPSTVFRATSEFCISYSIFLIYFLTRARASRKLHGQQPVIFTKQNLKGRIETLNFTKGKIEMKGWMLSYVPLPLPRQVFQRIYTDSLFIS